MSKKIVFLLSIVVFSWFTLANVCFARRFLTKEEALKKVFGEGVKIVTENKELTGTALLKVKEKLGGSLTNYQKGSKSKEVEEKTNYDFYFVLKDGKKTAVAIIDEEPGKWGPVEFVIALNPGGTVTRVEVMSSEEKRGQLITRHSFMSQFEGKTGKDPIQLDKDINGVSGATVSSNCVTFAVKKAVILYEQFYLNK